MEVHAEKSDYAAGSGDGEEGFCEVLDGKGTVTLQMLSSNPDILKTVAPEDDEAGITAAICEAVENACRNFNDMRRIDELGVAVERMRCKRLLIDHHLDPVREQFGHIISHPEMSSTSELLFRLLDAMGETKNLTFAAAEDLYAGIATDTGFFSFNSNDPDLFVIVSELMRKGIDKDRINRNIQNNYSADRLKFIGYVLYEKLQVFPDLHASVFAIKKEELAQFHYVKGDMEGVVNMPLQIKGHKLSIALREDTERPLIRVSTRSVDDLPCNEFCEQFFNGGGHKNAAGGTLECSMEEAVELTMKALDEWRERLEN